MDLKDNSVAPSPLEESELKELENSQNELKRCSSYIEEYLVNPLRTLGQDGNFEQYGDSLFESSQDHLGESIVHTRIVEMSYGYLRAFFLLKVEQNKLLEKYRINLELLQKADKVGEALEIDIKNLFALSLDGKSLLTMPPEFQREMLMFLVTFDLSPHSKEIRLSPYKGLQKLKEDNEK